MNSFTSYHLISRSLPETLARTAKQPSVAREIAYYQSKIGNVKTIDDFLKDTRLFTFAMKAWGLEDMAYAKGLMRKVLEGGIDDPSSPANRLASGRFREFAAVFNFKSYGKATTAFDKVQQGTVDSFIRQTLEKEKGEQNTAIQLALYFERKAPSIKSAMHILADRNLLKVVQTALDIPAFTASGRIDAQASLIEQKLNVSDLQDPSRLKKFLQRFAARYDLVHGTPNVGAGLMGGVGLNGDLLMSLQRLR